MKDDYVVGRFIRDRNRESVSLADVIFQYNSIVSNPSFKVVLFIEGMDDRKFYREFIHRFCGCRQNELYMIDNGYQGSKVVVAKMLHYCMENYRGTRGKQMHFLVDRDYDGVKNLGLSEEECTVLTVLPCYSFENYYFDKDNLDVVFDAFDWTPYKGVRNEYVKKQDIFMNLLLEYCACKKTAQVLELDDKPIGVFMEEPLRRVCFTKTRLFSKEDLVLFQDRLIRWVNGLPRLSEIQMRIIEKEIAGNTREIKGKLLFMFLIDYLKHLQGEGPLNTDDSWKKWLYSLSSRMDIELVMGTGLNRKCAI